MKLLVLYVLVFVYLLYITSGRFQGYVWLLPTHPAAHPNSALELQEVIDHVNTRTPEDVAFHRLTDRSVSDAFIELLGPLGWSVEELDAIVEEDIPEIKARKLWHNRPRPWQLYPGLDRLETTTGWTPSFPAGHAWQARTLARRFSDLYPGLAPQLWELADRCKIIRVKAGLHYPSD